MKKKIFRVLWIMLLTLSLLLAGGCADKSKEAVKSNKIRIGSNRAIGTVTPYLAQALGYFDNKDYEIEILEFSDGAALMEAMAA